MIVVALAITAAAQRNGRAIAQGFCPFDGHFFCIIRTAITILNKDVAAAVPMSFLIPLIIRQRGIIRKS